MVTMKGRMSRHDDFDGNGTVTEQKVAVPFRTVPMRFSSTVTYHFGHFLSFKSFTVPYHTQNLTVFRSNIYSADRTVKNTTIYRF